MSRARNPASPWDRRPWWTAPFRWSAAPFVLVARPFFQWMAGTRAFALVGPKIVPRMDRAVHRLTGGRILMSRSLVPTLLLITTGHRTGHLRRAPMTCLPEPDGSFLVVGSNWGRPAHPHWSTSLLHRPEATVSYRGHNIPVAARLLEGAERAEAWPRLLRVWPVYDRYTLRSGRRLRVFRLEPRQPRRPAPPAPHQVPPTFGQPPPSPRPRPANPYQLPTQPRNRPTLPDWPPASNPPTPIQGRRLRRPLR